MKKILMVNTVEFERNGISKVIINILNNIDNQKFIVDLVCADKVDRKYVDSEVQNVRKFFYLNNRKSNLPKYLFNLYKIIMNYEYDILHIHGNSSTMCFEAIVGKFANVKKIVVHCHNNHTDHPNLNKFLKPILHMTADKKVACSTEAAKWLYGNSNSIIMKNCIDVHKYELALKNRDQYRQELGLSNDFILGHVGLFNEQKNQIFLLDLLKKLLIIKPNAKLLLIGDGPLLDAFNSKVTELNLQSHVVILSNRDDVPNLLAVMDVFVFPSKWEGFGIALLEAQASGLPCFVSSNVSNDVNVTGQLKYIELGNLEEWFNSLKCVSIDDREQMCKNSLEKIIKTGYTLESLVTLIENIYLF